jgi:hypothetical protein
MLDIPDFLRREPLTPEQLSKLRRKTAKLADENRPAIPQADFKVNRDSEGRPLPRNMDAGSWALLRSIEKENKVKEKEDEAAKKERFRLLAAERAEARAIKKAAREAHKATKL